MRLAAKRWLLVTWPDQQVSIAASPALNTEPLTGTEAHQLADLLRTAAQQAKLKP